MLFLGPSRKILVTLLLFAFCTWGDIPEGLAGTVRGVVLAGNGQPVAYDQVHLENTVTGNLYLAATEKDGSFSVDVPPGWYNLRERNGTIIKSGIRIDLQPVNLGSVALPHRTIFWRLFQRERIAPVIVDSPAPATVDTSPHPFRIPKVNNVGAATVPKSGEQGAPPASVSSAAGAAAVGSPAPSAVPQPSMGNYGVPAASTGVFPPPIMPDYKPPESYLAAPGVQ
jgi:hypothetical protein